MLAPVAAAVILLARYGSAAPTSALSTHIEGEPFATSSVSEPSSTAQPAAHSEYAAERSPVLSVITIALICAVLCALLIGRLAYVKRYYDLGLRSFFIPPSGLHVLGLHVRGPVATKRPDQPPLYRGPGAPLPRRRQHRRGRQVQGPDVDETGARRGERDQDDVWDGEQAGTAADLDIEKDVLPGYSVDVDLPGYQNWSRRHSVQHLETVDSASPEVLSDQQYEATTRHARRQGGEDVEMQEARSTMSVTTGGPHQAPAGSTSANNATERRSDDLGEQRLS
ncbi:hypothetical protein ACM66B_004653 [Microbotryomycetes sp. NB124-2]